MGPLCENCNIQLNYGRSGSYYCAICNDKEKIIIKSVLVYIFSLIVILSLTYSNISKV